MSFPRGHRETAWADGFDWPEYSPIDRDLETDVCIVGAGIAGLSTAYLLTREGRAVVVVDDGPIGGGQTHRTSAHLSNAIDDRYVEIERLHGRGGALLAADSHTAAIERIERAVADEQIECGFRRVEGYLFLPPGESTKLLDDEFLAARRTGIVEVDRLDRAPLEFDTGPCLVFHNQAQFQPLEYLAGLARAIVARRGHIATGSHVERIEGGESACVSIRGGHTIRAKHVVVATNTPVNDMFAIHTKQAPYISYVTALAVPVGSVPEALFWDAADPYHYVRLQPARSADDSEQLLIVGGEDHKTGQADDGQQRFERLEAWARQRFPVAGPARYRWSGQVLETIDGLALIGRNPGDHENVLVATGDSGMGLTHGTIAGMLLCDLIQGRHNPWASLYDPSRKTLAAAGEFAKENLNVAAQYTAHLTGGDVDDVDDILPGEGAIVRKGLHKLAVFRDHDGKATVRSAICGHMGCVVAWNGVEKTWDCPCHGSRFDCEGRVIVGPANNNLAPAELAD